MNNETETTQIALDEWMKEEIEREARMLAGRNAEIERRLGPQFLIKEYGVTVGWVPIQKEEVWPKGCWHEWKTDQYFSATKYETCSHCGMKKEDL